MDTDKELCIILSQAKTCSFHIKFEFLDNLYNTNALNQVKGALKFRFVEMMQYLLKTLRKYTSTAKFCNNPQILPQYDTDHPQAMLMCSRKNPGKLRWLEPGDIGKICSVKKKTCVLVEYQHHLGGAVEKHGVTGDEQIEETPIRGMGTGVRGGGVNPPWKNS